jgi:hypothetical protein
MEELLRKVLNCRHKYIDCAYPYVKIYDVFAREVNVDLPLSLQRYLQQFEDDELKQRSLREFIWGCIAYETRKLVIKHE